MSDLIIHCSKGRIKVIGYSVEAFGETEKDFFFQVKGFKWLKNKKEWDKQARYHRFEGYDTEGIHCNEDGEPLN